MPKSHAQRVYGPRHEHYLNDVNLPIRYLSDDGLCAIDVNRKIKGAGMVGDTTSEFAISESAARILNSCVVNKEIGGVDSNFSESIAMFGGSFLDAPCVSTGIRCL